MSGIGAAGYAGIWSGPGGAAGLPLSYPSGCIAKYLSATQLQISVGKVRDDTDTEDIVVTGTLTVTITNTGANGRNVDTAEQANKWYAVCVIKNPTTGAVAGFLINQDDLGGFTWPAGYTIKRRVGWWRNNNSSNLRKGRYIGKGSFRKFTYDVPSAELYALNGGSATSWTNVDISEWVPPTSHTAIFNNWYDPYGTTYAEIRPDGSTVTTPWIYELESTYPSNSSFSEVETSDSQIIEYTCANALDDLHIYVGGFYDEI